MLCFGLASMVLLSSCVSGTDETNEDTEQVSEQQSDTEAQPEDPEQEEVTEASESEQPEEVTETEVEPEQIESEESGTEMTETEPEIEEGTETEPEAEEVATVEAGIVVSEEVYTETFESIQALIEELNQIIRDEDYDAWLTRLTRNYIDHFGSDEVLKINSDKPLLQKYNVTLRTLRDYFTYVVVPSRSNARLDDLVFIDNDHVKAIMVIKEQRTILYQLERHEGVWKVGL